ncbi:Uncharacterised protein [Mycobacteroides abscessus]|nr:Uncharacterised protein [Mycobacteroides abscessus]
MIGGRRGVVLAQRVVSGGGGSTGGHGSQREACLAYLPDFTATVYTPAADSGQLVGGGVTRVAGACGRGGEPVSGGLDRGADPVGFVGVFFPVLLQLIQSGLVLGLGALFGGVFVDVVVLKFGAFQRVTQAELVDRHDVGDLVLA